MKYTVKIEEWAWDGQGYKSKRVKRYMGESASYGPSNDCLILEANKELIWYFDPLKSLMLINKD